MALRIRFLPASLILVANLTGCGGGSSGAGGATPQSSMLTTFANANGAHRSVAERPDLVADNPFFQSLGTNGRACVTCHQPSLGWTITPEFIQSRFDATSGEDPLFRAVDGSNSPQADVSSVQARRRAYSLLLTKGLIRVGLPIPADAEFTLEAADDPYGFASAQELSLFRRPLPSTNLKFLSTLMWDGRESLSQHMNTDLARQANNATQGHAEASRDLTPAEQAQIVDFETGLFTAQVFDFAATILHAGGASGGVDALARQEFFIGINDPLGGNPSGQAFDANAFRLYAAWRSLPGSDALSAARRAVGRGEEVFNTKPIAIVGVKGLNDELNAQSIPGTCTTCHDSPNVGNHSVPAPLDLGLTDASRRTPDMPLYTLRNKITQELIQTTDPGRGLITGKWKDVGRFKGPILRALAARAPYFHNGLAKDLRAVVDFYDQRFAIGFSDGEKADLVAFLAAL